ncbi:MAG: NRDE family protein [Rhodospirillales bacterium]|nr:NRDE family protein [Rhodospirillales bacterium]
MCTVIILRRPGHAWPLLIAANRDEMQGRPSQAPARHWPDRSDVTAGLDELAGGTWMAINEYGVVSAILNRRNSLGPEDGFRSRGEIPLEAVDHADASVSVEALCQIEPTSYRPFNLVIADSQNAYWIKNTGDSIEKAEIPVGLSMITAYDLNDEESPRVKTFLHRFRDAQRPDVDKGEWSAWQSLLGNRLHDANEQAMGDSESGPLGAMNVVTNIGFGTVSSSLIAVPSLDREGVKPVWLFCQGRPDENEFVSLSL